MDLIQLKKNEDKKTSLSYFQNEFIKIKKNQKLITFFMIFIIILNLLIIIHTTTDKEKMSFILKKEISNLLINDSYPDINNYLYNYGYLSKKILEPYIEKQNDFCINPHKYYNEKIEKQIKLHHVSFKDIDYDMFIYKGADIVSKTIVYYKYYEPTETTNILDALNFYGKNNNIKNNKDILMLDIGGNIGWYPSFLGRYGYTILTFEPNENNYYILRKNFCYLNKDSNIVIINKGLSNEEKNCSFYKDIDNIGNGMAICDEEIGNKEIKKEFQKTSEISLTKLSNFIPYLYNKHLALIKIDIEGFEGKAIEGGIELIIKFHIPYILLEFTPRALIEHGTNPKKFLKLFVDNGYKIKIDGFFNRPISIKQLFNKVNEMINIYFVYEN